MNKSTVTPLLPEHTIASIRDICTAHNLYLIDIVIRGSAQKRIVEIYTDSESGVTLDLCAQISSSVDELFEKEQMFSGQYRLEVSSPGTDRPIEYPWQFRKHRGRLLKVTLADGTVQQGRINEANEESFVLDIPVGKREITATEISYNSVQRAVVELEW